MVADAVDQKIERSSGSAQGARLQTFSLNRAASWNAVAELAKRVATPPSLDLSRPKAGDFAKAVSCYACHRTPRRFATFDARVCSDLWGDLRLFLILLWPLASCLTLHAHAPDTSYLRAVVSKHALELRFTFDIATLHRIERLDANYDGKVTRAEAEAAMPDIANFLRQTITLELNGQKADLGTLKPLGWPVDAGEQVEEKNFGQTLLHFTFTTDSQKLIEDFYVLYEVFAQFGVQHRAVANIEQEAKHMEVVFTQFEPDYLYDTFWRPEAEAGAVGGQAFAHSFRGALDYTWNLLGLPVMLLAACSLMPRKLPWLVTFAVLFWFSWDFLGRMTKNAGMIGDARLVPAAMSGMLAAMLVCALIVYPASLALRRLCDRRWFVVAAWLVLIYGGLYVTGATFACRGPG